MEELKIDETCGKDHIFQFLVDIGKESQFNRLMNSIWTEEKSGLFTSLDLSRLDIEHINTGLFQHPSLRNIEYLYLQGNKLDEAPSNIFPLLGSLKGLNLPNNNITAITQSSFSGLNSLEWLNLSSNDIIMIERSAFDDLSNLTTLSLAHNSLETLEIGSFNKLSKLEKLNLSNNGLKTIDASVFRGLDKLQLLNLQSNKLIKVGQNIASILPLLEKIYLKHNPGFTLNNTLETRYEILEVFRSHSESQTTDIAMTELLNFEDDQVIVTFNQLIEDPRWDGGIGRVSNYKLSQVLGIPVETIARKIETLITQKKLSNVVHFDNNDPMAFSKHYWIRKSGSKGSINTGINDPKCLWCNQEISDPFDACPKCGLRCEICKFSIKQTQKFDVCTSESDQACQELFHQSEFLEWVRIYGSCPKCGQEIDLNLYQVSQDYSRKVSALVEQDMELPSEVGNSNDFLIPMAMSILINLKKVKSGIDTSEDLIREQGKEARERHQQVLKELQPLATEIVLITAFLDRLEANALTEKTFKASIDKIGDRFSVFEDNADMIFESHEKDKSKREKIKKLALKGGLKGGQVGVKALVERSGLMGKISSYVSLPTKDGLKAILSRIGQGIRDKTGDPTTWIRLGAAFLI